MGDSLEFGDVLQEVRGAMNPGRLKLGSNSVIFKNIKTGIVDTLLSSDIEKAIWLIRARGYCLKVVLASGNVHRFDGLKESEYEKIDSFMRSNYDVALKKRDVSTKGWNWGVANFVGNSLDFAVENHNAFDIPLNNVSHTVAAKNEVTLEFHLNDDAAVSLTELRFHIPSDTNPDTDIVQEFHDNVQSKADIIQATGDAIANFTEVQCLTPRGRYDIKIYQTFMQLHGKTFDYKIPYTTILRLFLLPHRDNRQMFFVVSLDPPIKQGQTRYHFIIILFNKEYETNLELSLSEKDLESKYEGKLTKNMAGPEYEIISRVMKTLVNRKITVPGTFVGHSGTQSIACSYKAATGYLYPLERGFIFVHKPPIHIRFDEVAHVNFARSSGSNRSFDFEVETKNHTVYTFVSIEKDEYAKFYDFVKHKKLRVKNIGDKLKGGAYDDMMGSDDEGHHDAYLERMKAEGKQREDDDDEDEDSEEDEDFNPENEKQEEPDDEFESSPDSTDSEGEGGEDKAAGAGAGASGDEKPRKKEKSKPKSAKTVSEAPRKRRGNKPPRDETKPKRPMSGYFLWLNANREQIKKDNPSISFTDITKLGGEKWRELKDKSEWEKKAVEAKKQYEEAMLVWQEEQKDKPKSSSPASSPKAQKSSSKRTPKPSGSPKKAKKSKTTGSPVKESFKSKEFISDFDDSSDDEKKPKKAAKAKPKAKPKAKDQAKAKDEASPPRRKGRRGGEVEMEIDSDNDDNLPAEESDASMTDGSAGSASGSGSGSDEESGSGAGSGSGEESD